MSTQRKSTRRTSRPHPRTLPRHPRESGGPSSLFLRQSFLALVFALSLLVLAATGCGGAGTSSTSDTSGSGLGPLVTAGEDYGGGFESSGGGGNGLGDLCPDNPKELDLTVTIAGLSGPNLWPVLGGNGKNPTANPPPFAPIIVYTGPDQNPGNTTDRTLVQMEVTTEYPNAVPKFGALQINVLDLGITPVQSAMAIGSGVGLDVNSSPLSSGGTSLARFNDSLFPGLFDLVLPPPNFDWNSYSPGSKIIGVQVCQVTLVIGGVEQSYNVGSKPVFLEIRPGTGP